MAAAEGMTISGGRGSPNTCGAAPVESRTRAKLAAIALWIEGSLRGAARSVTLPPCVAASHPASPTARLDSGESSTGTTMVSVTSTPSGHLRAIRIGIGTCSTAANAAARPPRASRSRPSQPSLSPRCQCRVSSAAGTIRPGLPATRPRRLVTCRLVCGASRDGADDRVEGGRGLARSLGMSLGGRTGIRCEQVRGWPQGPRELRWALTSMCLASRREGSGPLCRLT